MIVYSGASFFRMFVDLFLRIAPLYLLIAAGFIAGRFARVKKESITALMLYVLDPIIIFYATLTVQINSHTLLLPLVMFVLGTGLCLATYAASKFLWKDAHRNILAFSAGTGNTGYFGLPIAAALLGDWTYGTIVLCMMGLVIYQSTIGFYITAKGHHTVGESMQKLLKLPGIYAFLLGIAAQAIHLHLPVAIDTLFLQSKAAYGILGMMLIGLGVADVKRIAIDWVFTIFAFISKFICWPLATGFFIFLDLHHLHLFTAATHQVLLFLSIVPMAATTVVYATELRIEPQKTALTVLFSTLVAAVFIPVFAATFIL